MLVMLHGFGGTHRHWDRVRPERYLAPDIRGHGASGGKRPVTLEACIEDIARLPPARLDLCGYSMGGRLALHAALVLGERISSLTLISTSAGIEDAGERAVRRASDEQLARQIELEPIERYARAWADLALFADDPPDVRAAAAGDALRCPPAGLAAALRGLGAGTMPAVWERLRELTLPVAVLAGERDAKYVRHARRLTAELPRAALNIVPGAGHRLALEAPGAVSALLRRSR